MAPATPDVKLPSDSALSDTQNLSAVELLNDSTQNQLGDGGKAETTVAIPEKEPAASMKSSSKMPLRKARIPPSLAFSSVGAALGGFQPLLQGPLLP